MKILQISSAKTFGGGERHFVDLCRELTRRGHDVFAALRPSNDWQERLDFLPAANFLHVSIRNSFGMFSTTKIAQFIEKENIDIVHAHEARDYLAASVASRMAGCDALVLTRQVTFPLKPFYRFAMRNVAAAIAVSPGVNAQLRKVFPEDKIFVIPNGVSIDAGSTSGQARPGLEFRNLHGIPLEADVVATVGELNVIKGQRDFVLAAQEVAKRYPECRFVIVGRDKSIDKTFRRELKRLVNVFGLKENFLWLDWLDDLVPLLDAADIFVSPSHTESSGRTIIDAMAIGCAVVATDTEGAKSLLQYPELLIPVMEPLKLADRIVGLLENKLERKAFGEKLRGIAHKNHGLGRMVDEIEAIYKRVQSK